MKLLKLLLLSITFAGCSVLPQSERSTTSIPIETNQSDSAQITLAEAYMRGGSLFVLGRVERLTLAKPPMCTHIDLQLLDGKGAVVESLTENYWPTEFGPASPRGGSDHATFSARFKSTPGANARIKIQLHAVAKSECEWYKKS
jgi:hypothetical protein